MRRLNTIHITVFETRGLPSQAASIHVLCGGQKVKLANLDKEGKLLVEAGNTLVGTETAETLWLHVYDNGVTYDTSLGSCMVLLTSLELHFRPFEGWLPMVTLDGKVIGHVAVAIFGDWAESVRFGVVKGTLNENTDLLTVGDPHIEVRVRDIRHRTSTPQSSLTPAWNEVFKFFVGTRDKVYLALFDSKESSDEKFGTAEIAGMDILKCKGQSMWVPIKLKDGTESCKVLVQIEEDQWQMQVPVRILQARGLTAGDTGASELYVVGKCSSKDYKTSLRPNVVDAVWDEEFLLEGRRVDALHLQVKDKDAKEDDTLGEVFIPVSELLAHSGEQLWVELTGGRTTKHLGKLLLWVQPPPGSVYPDTLTQRRLAACEEWERTPLALRV